MSRSAHGEWSKIPNWVLKIAPHLPGKVGLALIYAAREANFGRGLSHSSLASYLNCAMRTAERTYAMLRQLNLIDSDGRLIPVKNDGQETAKIVGLNPSKMTGVDDKTDGRIPSVLSGRWDRNDGQIPSELTGSTPNMPCTDRHKIDAEGRKEVKASRPASFPKNWRDTPAGKKLCAYLSSRRYAEELERHGAAWCEKWSLEEIVAAWNTAKDDTEIKDKGLLLTWILHGERPIAERYLSKPSELPPPKPMALPEPEPLRRGDRVLYAGQEYRVFSVGSVWAILEGDLAVPRDQVVRVAGRDTQMRVVAVGG